MKQNFDSLGWFFALSRAVEARRASWTDVSKATGVSSTTLSRMKDGRHPDAASLAALSAWAGINPADYCPKVPQPVNCPHCHGTGRVMPAQPPGEAAVQPTAEARDAMRLAWIWKNCRVVYFPPDGAYPIEHNPRAVGYSKEPCPAILAFADAAMKETP